MSDEKNVKSTGAVVRVYIAYWLAFGFIAGSLANTAIVGVLTFYLSLPVGAAFLLAYDCKDRIKVSPLRFMSVFLLLMALMIVPLVDVLDFYFSYVCVVAICAISVMFSYAYFLRGRISRSPWLYLMPVVLLYLFMMVAIMAMPVQRG